MKQQMQTVQTMDLKDYIKKINQVESMLEELKQALFYFNKEFQESIKRGERDIKDGRVTICKTEKELDEFFRLI